MPPKKKERIYNNTFDRTPKTTVLLTDHLSWIDRNKPENMAKDGFIQHLIALGIKAYQEKQNNE